MRQIRTLLLSLLSVAGLNIAAQSLNIHEGNVTYSYPYDETTTMVFGTNTLTINGEEYNLTQVTGITGSAEQLEAAHVAVTYDDNQAFVVLSGELRGRVNATVDGADVVLTDLGSAEEGEIPEVTYSLSGTSANGSFTQNGSYKCTISLEGVSLSSNACPFAIDNGKRIDIIVTEKTQNTFADGAANERKSAFYIKGHAEFSGAGILNISGTQRHAYSSNEYTLLKRSFEGTINILSAASDGMHIDQTFEMRNGTLNFEKVSGDNIDVASTTDTEDLQNGQVIISGGRLNCNANTDDTKCIKCETSMTINGGDIRLKCIGDGTKGLSVGTDLVIEQDVTAASNERPYIYIYATGDTYTNPKDATDTSKCRGIKVKRNFTFDGGTIERDTESTIKASKIIDIDGTYTYKSGLLKNCSISAS